MTTGGAPKKCCLCSVYTDSLCLYIVPFHSPHVSPLINGALRYGEWMVLPLVLEGLN